MLSHFINILQYIASWVDDFPLKHHSRSYIKAHKAVYEDVAWASGVWNREEEVTLIASLSETHTHVPEMILRLWAVLHSYAKSPRDLTSASTCGRRWSSRAQLTLHYGSHPLMSADADIKNKVGVTAFKWAPGDLRFQLDRLFQQSALLWHKCIEWGNNLFTTSYEMTFGRCLKEM